MLLDVLKGFSVRHLANNSDSAHLTGTEGALDVPGTGVAGVVLSPVEVLHHPVEPPPQVVLGPPLAVVKEQLLRPLPGLLADVDTVPTGDHHLHILEALHIPEVGLAVKYGSIDIGLVRLFIE